MIKVLFVCLGNICRSPMAEAIFRHKVENAGLSAHIQTDSAGTSGWHKNYPPHQDTREILDKHKIPYDGIKGRELLRQDFNIFDYIIGMDKQNLADINKLSQFKGKADIRLLSFYLPNPGWCEVPDPWYTGNFKQTYELLDQGTEALLNYIVAEHHLG